ncbi:hypothetical protein FB45DRAFT_740721 [Roridomyces roridus]|uniref:Uncharacterized protein n=1 Tax=Roridomyces roridus TaxID=1738132 RepID=A0AAD7C5N9_9AGAR|nr:hypothetical protein FB45DRAFT_740721 [Roridomyces roridus]
MWIPETQQAIHALLGCLARDQCGQNQTKVVIVTSSDLIAPMEGGREGQDAVWSLSTRQALDNMGYTVLYSPNMERNIQLYHIFHDLVKVVIADTKQTRLCWWEHDSCHRSSDNPSGIPVWKILTLFNGPDVNSPLGEKWTLSPEKYTPSDREGNTYLGYSIEENCRKYPFVPHGKRKSQAFIHASSLHHFLPNERAWPPQFFDLASSATGLSFVAGAKAHSDTSPSDLAASIKNLGGDADLHDALANSAVLVGMGDPAMPTPYDALCLGVPFINPILNWDPADATDRRGWNTEHNALNELSPPYVYHVLKNDRDGFLQAVEDAKANPIPSLVLDRMKIESVQQRLGLILEHDWRAEAAVVLEQRKKADQGPVSFLDAFIYSWTNAFQMFIL